MTYIPYCMEYVTSSLLLGGQKLKKINVFNISYICSFVNMYTCESPIMLHAQHFYFTKRKQFIFTIRTPEWEGIKCQGKWAALAIFTALFYAQ